MGGPCQTRLISEVRGTLEDWRGTVSPPHHLAASVEHLLQICVQEHSGRIQLVADSTEFGEGGVHLLEVLAGAVVGL